MDKLPIVEPCDTVQMEAVQTDHVTVVTLEDQDGAPAQTKEKILWVFHCGENSAITKVALHMLYANTMQSWIHPFQGHNLNIGGSPQAV